MVIDEADVLLQPNDCPLIQNPKSKIQNFRGGFRVLMVSEGSGGHLVPALEVARALARQAEVRVVFARRLQTGQFLDELRAQAAGEGVELWPVSVRTGGGRLARRLRQGWTAAWMWTAARQWLAEFRPHVVVGFGGWVSVPVIVAARQARIPVLVHEQNAQLGRANRLLAPHADRVALSFPPSSGGLDGVLLGGHRAVSVTGLPVRPEIGEALRDAAAERLGLEASRFTIVVLGGSQGSRFLNTLMRGSLCGLTAEERRGWQVIHASGSEEAASVACAYATAGVRALVVPHLTEMAQAYALADLVIARAGASTLAELAQAGRPAILIPYPLAGGHQRENARLAETAGGAIVLEERQATAPRLLALVRRLQAEPSSRLRMAQQMRTLSAPDAIGRLVREIISMTAVRQKGSSQEVRP